MIITPTTKPIYWLAYNEKVFGTGETYPGQVTTTNITLETSETEGGLIAKLDKHKHRLADSFGSFREVDGQVTKLEL